MNIKIGSVRLVAVKAWPRMHDSLRAIPSFYRTKRGIALRVRTYLFVAEVQ